MIAASEAVGDRILLVEAPHGYGKSGFAEGVLALRSGPVVRVRLSAGERLAGALRRAMRRAGLAVDAGETSTEDIDASLAALAAHAAEAHVLVDDAHTLDAQDLAGLLELVTDLPTSCTAVVCGRDLVALRPVVGRPGVRVVRAADLRMDAADIARLLELPPGHATVTELLHATEGWPAAVGLAVARLAREPSWSVAGASGVRRLLQDLVGDLVRSDPRVLTFAQLPLVDEEVAALVSPLDLRIPDLPLHRSGPWLVVAPLFAELAAHNTLPRELAEQVAAYYHQRGETVSALELLRRQAPEAVVGFLADLPWTELEELDPSEIAQVVDGLMPESSPEAAALLVSVAKAVELHDRALRARCLERVLDTALDGPLQRAAQAERARDLLRGGELDRGADLARSTLAGAAEEEWSTRARALITLGMREAYDCTPDSLARASRVFREAADLYQRVGERRLLSDTLARLGYTTLYIAGQPHEGAAAMSEALALLPVGDRARAMWLTMYADVLETVGRSEESDAAVREALEIGTRRRDPMTSGMAWWTRSWQAALRGDVGGVRRALDEVERNRGAWLTGGQEAEYLGSSAEHLTLVGDLVGYHRYVEQAEVLAKEIGYPEVMTTPRAFFEAEHGDPVVGLELLDELETMPGVAPGGAARRLLVRAVALRRAGDPDGAREALTRALRACADMSVPDLLHRQHPHQLALVADLLGEAAPSPAEPRLQMLGGFTLTVGESDRTPAPGHSATLVKVLALAGPTTTEAAIDLLWPGLDPGTGRARLRNLLNRLKERSGHVVHRQGDVLRLDPLVHVDADGFATAASAALAAPSQERVGRARHALALYKGDLLPGDVYDDWAAGARARLQRRFVALADLVAEDCVERGDLDEAASLFDLGIAAEPLDEQRPLRLCRLLAAQGRTGAARQVAGRTVAALRDLGVEPDPELLAYSV